MTAKKTTKPSEAWRKWTPERLAKFRATMKKQKRTGTGYYDPKAMAARKAKATKTLRAKPPERIRTPEAIAKYQATRAAQREARLAAEASPASNGNGAAHDDAGGQHFPLDMIPERLPPMAAPVMRPHKKKAGGTDFPNNAEGARLAVAMELLRTVNALLRRDDD